VFEISTAEAANWHEKPNRQGNVMTEKPKDTGLGSFKTLVVKFKNLVRVTNGHHPGVQMIISRLATGMPIGRRVHFGSRPPSPGGVAEIARDRHG
jgi:hypothetical protein